MSLSNQIRGIAVGIFLATTTFTIVNYTGSTSEAFPLDENPMTIDDARSVLEKDDLRVLSVIEYNELTDQIIQLTQEQELLLKEKIELENTIVEEDTSQEKEKVDQVSEEPQEGNIIYQTILRIESGMNSNDIARQLVRMNVISDERSFVDYILDRELDRLIKIGEFHVTSEMSTADIVKLITS